MGHKREHLKEPLTDSNTKQLIVDMEENKAMLVMSLF